MSEDQFAHLCYKLFVTNKDGVKLLELAKKSFLDVPIFPMSLDVQNNHGGPMSWAAFRSGQLDAIKRFEVKAKEYQLQQEAEQSKSKL